MLERWQNVKEIFNAALKREPSERAIFLNEICDGQTDLRGEVESLLASHDEANSFLELSAVAEVADVIEINANKLEAGKSFNHYKIINQIGSGGMGEVYLAQDKKLDRRVAIKILNEKFAKHESNLQRFVQEAKSASALNHPNILTIYEIGESEKSHFIVSEYIEGETLREMLQKQELKLVEVLDIAAQIAGALIAAHHAKIVHRDIKPENIIVRPDGLVKILDFGLAKLVEQKPIESEESTVQQNQTAKGIILGTINYMSPEQAKGERVDERTDIFSFGVVLYEMIAGQTPFAGESISETVANLINKTPSPLARYAADVPRDLERIAAKTLRKNADERYQTMKSLLADLRELREEISFDEKLERSTSPDKNATALLPSAAENTAPRTTESVIRPAPKWNRKNIIILFTGVLLVASSGFAFWRLLNRADQRQIESIAVLPFTNESGSADLDYLSDGMTETLINSLSNLPNLNVKARSSVFRYKGRETDAKQVGADLNVQAVLSGRVIQRGGDLTLYLSLEDVRTGNQIWGENYNRSMKNLVALQTEIARDVSKQLQTKLSNADTQNLTKNYTENSEAYQQYLLGRFYWNKRNKDDFYRAINHYSQAVRVDSNYAIAFAGLADVYIILQGYDDSAVPLDLQTKARENALKALSLDDTLSEAHLSNGIILQTLDFDFAGAEREFKRAIESDPKNAVAFYQYANFLMAFGRFDEAESKFRRALELEPASVNANRLYGIFLMLARRYEESEKQAKKTIELDPNFQGAYFSFANTLLLQGRYAEAVEQYAKSREVAGKPDEAAMIRASFKKGGWRGFILDIIKLDWTAGFRPKYIEATRFASIGEKQKALDALEDAFARRETFITLTNVDPRFDSLRDEPRFKDLLRRVGLTP
jgi:eukaryotic-like serine/threonine-protein kinase